MTPVRVRGYLDGGRKNEDGSNWCYKTGEGGLFWEFLTFGGHLVSCDALGNASGRRHNPKHHDPTKPAYLAIMRKQLEKGQDRSYWVIPDAHISDIVDGESFSPIC